VGCDVPVETYVDRAGVRVRAEREAVAAKRDAFEAFRDRVSEIPASTPTAATGRTMATAGQGFRADGSGDDRCRRVRTAFAETVQPHSVADVDGGESLLATIRSEFTDAIAVALAPTTEPSFSPELKRLLLSEAADRRTEADVTCRALAREQSELDDAADTVDGITTWIAGADETPLTDLGFEELRDRHERLADHRAACEDLVRDRQAFLRETTNRGTDLGIRHRSLLGYVYGELPVEHPVLATAARLEVTCRECQRAVRDHLVRRV
jgi:hypothetical protein